MVSSIMKECSILGMGTYIKANMSMAYRKDMVNTHGAIKAIIKETLSKVLEMDMVYGVWAKNPLRFTKGIIVWIKSQDMEFINGKMDGYIKEILIMIIEMVSESYIMEINWFIEDFGIMESKPTNK